MLALLLGAPKPPKPPKPPALLDAPKPKPGAAALCPKPKGEEEDWPNMEGACPNGDGVPNPPNPALELLGCPNPNPPLEDWPKAAPPPNMLGLDDCPKPNIPPLEDCPNPPIPPKGEEEL